MKKPIPFGKYYLLERINVGGMAEVYRAKAYGVEGFERLVAVKRILPNVAEDKEFIKMFVDEAKLAVQLNHANIAQIFDLGMVGSDYYIALEHVHGRDLRATFERCREASAPMPIAQACFCVMKVCEGLDYAHNKRDVAGRPLGLVHRDVSPQNVLVSFDGEVKLIDFGIAKAAGRGSQTEAGILKGKFGYMSPEQVRGLPIDRRSDVFACGIVLYELLTGERLFVGESDFSTLEKVRNVEILPPTTFNRRISPELERIVLKALAKDVEDRYQNAIDLHDELQAFVYTSGEFYSRKDLAAWMKKTFARELAAESAKLEEYRKFSPQQAPTPPAPPPVGARRRRPSGSAPPPIPGQARRSAPQPAQQMMAARKLDWDDDELETAIYDGPDSINTSNERPMVASGAIDSVMEQPSRDQDLASLVEKARDWNGESPVRAPLPPPKKTATGSGPKVAAPPPTLPPRPSSRLPVQAGRAARGTDAPPMLAIGQAVAQAPRRDSSAVAALAAMAERQRTTYEGPTIDLVDLPMGQGRAGLIAAIVAGAALLVGGIVAVVMLVGDDDVASEATAAPATAELSPDVLKQTGFDLVVRPAGIEAEVRLDGKTWGRAPLRFRNIAPGEHQIEVVAPTGFYNQASKVEVVAGEAPRLTIDLDGVPKEISITSEPAGASAVLIAEDGTRKELGTTPTTAKLDVHHAFKLELSLDGYQTKVATVKLDSDANAFNVALVASEKPAEEPEHASEAAPAPASRPEVAERSRESRSRSRHSSSERSHSKRSREDAATDALEQDESEKPAKVVKKEVVAPAPKEAPEKAVVAEKGTLLLGSKPPCQIFINGRNTGLKTPQRQISLAEGKHKVVLVNNEHSIRDAFIVKIEGGKRTKVIRNLTDKMK